MVDPQGKRFYVEVSRGESRRVYLPAAKKWTKPRAEWKGVVYSTGGEVKRKSSREFRALCARPEDELKRILVDGASQGMRFSQICAALGVGTRAVNRYLKSRPDMWKAWAEAKHKALWG